MSYRKAPSSFFLVPDEKVNYEPSVKLGNVLYRVTQPDLVLFDPENATPSLPLEDDASPLPPPKTLRNYNIEKDNAMSSKYGLFSKILEFFSVGVHASRSSGTDVLERYDIKSMTISMFTPSPAFLNGLQAQDCIRDVIENSSDRRAFLITGVIVASGVTFKSSHVENRENEASLGANASGVSVGPMGKRSRKRTLEVNWEDEGPTVLAFRVQKLQLIDVKLTATEETDGAYFGADNEAEEGSIEFDVALDESDRDGMEPEVVHDEFTGLDCDLYFPAE